MSLLLLLFAADPTGLQAALDSADSAIVHYRGTEQKITLSAGECKELAKLVKVDRELGDRPVGMPATLDVHEINVRKGVTTTQYTLIGAYALLYEGKWADLGTDRRLWQALRAHLKLPDLTPPPRSGLKIVETIDAPAEDVAVAGKFLITAAPSKLSVYRRDEKLVPIGSMEHGKFGASRVAVKDNRVFVTAETSGCLMIFSLEDGALRLIEEQEANSPVGLAIGGDHLYVIGRRKSLDIFSTKGGLSHVRTVTHEHMERPTAVAVHPEGQAVYVACHDRAMLAFRPNGDFLSAEVDMNVGGHIRPQDRGLNFASALLPIGDTLYVVGLPAVVSAWNIEDGKPLFMKRWNETKFLLGYPRARDLVLWEDRFWMAAGPSGLVSFEKWDNDLKLEGQSTDLESAYALAVADNYLYVVGKKLWVASLWSNE